MSRAAASKFLQTTYFTVVLLASHFVGAQDSATFEVQPLTRQHTFHVGERIPLELSFSSRVQGHFEINMAAYDRSGRMRYEEFDVTPRAGWSDPLARYFSYGYMGGGLSSAKVLGPVPTTMSINLNEWVRFDQPGTYSITVSTHRITDQTEKRVFNGDPPEAIRAKPFVLHIIAATPAWQAGKFQAARAQLDASAMVQGQQSAEHEAAISDLRFLGTAAAVKELAANLREDRQDLMYQSALGLIGAAEPMREVAIKTLEQKIDEPLFPICGWLIQALTILNVHGDPAASDAFEQRSRITDEVWRRVLAALPRKQGKARAATVQTLLGGPPANLNSESKEELAGVLSASFLDLTEEQRAQQLTWQWDLLRSTSMLPILQASAKLSLSKPGSNEMHDYWRREFKAIALRRWYELDPGGAYQEILSQIGSAHPSLTAQSLRFLPEQSLSQFESIWAQRLVESNKYEEETVLAGLLVRFGTGFVSAQVASKLRDKVGSWACAPQAAALAYLVKFNPEQAGPLLEQAVDASGSGKTGCYQQLFLNVAAHAQGTVLTDVAVASLSNANPRVVMDALSYLADYGRKEDQKPIWERYAKWSEQWSGKADVLDSVDRASLEQSGLDVGVGENLARALIANQGWLADSDLIKRVTSMCVGRQMCQSVQQISALDFSPYQVGIYHDASSEKYNVGQYTAKSIELLDEKIAQFPKGTVFQLVPNSPQNGDEKALEKQVREVFNRNGMSLQTAPN